MKLLFLSKSLLTAGWLLIFTILLVVLALEPTKVIPNATKNNASGVSSSFELPNFNMPNISTLLLDKKQFSCLSKNIFYEAGIESFIGKIFVGLVVMNRLEQSANSTICGVVQAKDKNKGICQFSWVCQDVPEIPLGSVAWKDSLASAKIVLVLNKLGIDLSNGATHYHATYVKPDWSESLTRLVQIDSHIFYKKE